MRDFSLYPLPARRRLTAFDGKKKALSPDRRQGFGIGAWQRPALTWGDPTLPSMQNLMPGDRVAICGLTKENYLLDQLEDFPFMQGCQVARSDDSFLIFRRIAGLLRKNIRQLRYCQYGRRGTFIAQNMLS